jgi:putative phage-type endonuclease
MIKQQTEEWFTERLGCVTGSRIYDVIHRKKNGEYSVNRDHYMKQLAKETITGVRIPTRSNEHTERGIKYEPVARFHYAMLVCSDVRTAGFCFHDKIGKTGASPDGFVGDDGILEIKCPTEKNHLAHFLDIDAGIPERYYPQVQWELACTKRKWAHYVSFNLECKPREMYVKLIERDERYIIYLEDEVIKFQEELSNMIYNIYLEESENG